MSRGLPKTVKVLLNKARESALLAVETYNRPGTVFRSRGYIILMQIAWLSLFLAIFHKGGIKPYYRKDGSKRFVKIDGEPKPWALNDCIRQYWGDRDNPVAQNLRFFIPLRNKIEHRELPELDIEVFGECQALLFNFEEMIINEFGEKYSLNESLAISLQFSRLRQSEKMQSIRQLMKPLAEDINKYIKRFRSSLSDDIFGDMAYSYKVFLLPNVGNHRLRDSIAIEWVPYSLDNPKEMEKYEKVMAIIKEKHIPIVNRGRFRPSDVKNIVSQALGPDKKFSVNLHTKCWQLYNVRPLKGDSNVTKCKTDYCLYDEVHNDFVYTQTWVDFLINELKDDEKYQNIVAFNKD